MTVKSRIVGGQFDGAEIAYRLRNRKDAWKIIDVVIEGVSLVSNYRSQFATVLNGGTSTFIALILLAPSDSHVFSSFFKVRLKRHIIDNDDLLSKQFWSSRSSCL